MASILSPYPAVGFHFAVNFLGIPGLVSQVRFMEVSGLKAELETESLTEAGNNRFTHVLPLRTKHSTLVLKRGLPSLGLSPLTTWAEAAIYFMEIFPIEVQVSLLNEKSFPLKLWNFSKAYAVSLEYSGLNAKESGIVIESLELAYQFATPVIP
jgi:phage tail-like protein